MSSPTSEVARTPEPSGNGDASEKVTGGGENSSERHAAPGAPPDGGVGASGAGALLQLLRGLAGGLQPPAPAALIKFDPDKPDADIEGWCKINEVIIKHKDFEGTDLLLSLMQALRGRAATCLTKINPESLTWENIKNTLMAKFAKPMLMQDYFDRVIKFKMHHGPEKDAVVDEPAGVACGSDSGAVVGVPSGIV